MRPDSRLHEPHLVFIRLTPHCDTPRSTIGSHLLIISGMTRRSSPRCHCWSPWHASHDPTSSACTSANGYHRPRHEHDLGNIVHVPAGKASRGAAGALLSLAAHA